MLKYLLFFVLATGALAQTGTVDVLIRIGSGCQVPKTGQTTSFFPGDDGDYEGGAALPSPRFTEGTGASSNCVTDTLSGLVWLKNPDATTRNWTNAIIYCEALNGDSGRGGFTDWRLPNEKEIFSLTDGNGVNPRLPAGHPFLGVVFANYWTGTAYLSTTARYVSMASGNMGFATIGTEYNVWPVRGP